MGIINQPIPKASEPFFRSSEAFALPLNTVLFGHSLVNVLFTNFGVIHINFLKMLPNFDPPLNSKIARIFAGLSRFILAKYLP